MSTSPSSALSASKNKVLIIGASGGIGRAFVTLYANDPNVDHIFALSRSGKTFDHETVTSGVLDFNDDQNLTEVAARLKPEGPFSVVIVATGFLHNDTISPEKNLRGLERAGLTTNFAINTIGPALCAKHFLPLLPKGKRGVFAALSARVGSISDNRLGGWYSYRASKAALNMILKGLSIEQGRRHKDHIILGLHPGTVDTGLSAPFQSNVAEGKLFTPQFSAQKLRAVINDATPDQSGTVIDWDGKTVPA